MISLFSLLLPIILSAILVFIISSVLHMLFKYHNSDYQKIPDEDKVLEDLRKHNIPAGDYIFPCTYDNKERSSKEFKDKLQRGPSGVVTFYSKEAWNMGSSLAQWFVYCLIISIFAAYVAGRALGPEAHYLAVFRFTGVTAFAGYSLGLMQQSIWWKKKWSSTIKSMIDGLIYALFTAGVFGWLWP